MIELHQLARAEWGRLLAALLRAVRDFDVAEEALQDAFAAAVPVWAAQGAPSNARGWLYTAARNRALDLLRREGRLAQVLAQLAPEERLDPVEPEEIPDERLRLLFTCCHPALALEAQVALTLRTLCGLTTEEIARAFLTAPATLAQRLVRAKAKIRDAGIPYRVPELDELPARLDGVLAVLYLVFNEGHGAGRDDLCAEAIRLARLLRALHFAEADALLGLFLLTEARRAARFDAQGEVVLLEAQDRSLWNRALIDEGRALVLAALQHGAGGTYALEAAIAAVHADAPSAAQTDWAQIVGLYDVLLRRHPTAIVRLNRAVAVSMAQGPESALPLVDALQGELDAYHLWHSARADLLRRLGRLAEARAAYQRAFALAPNEADRRFLQRRLEAL